MYTSIVSSILFSVKNRLGDDATLSSSDSESSEDDFVEVSIKSVIQ